MRIFRQGLQGYGVAVDSAVLAGLITHWAGARGNRIPFTLFLCAILVSAFFGGLRAGLLATLLAAGFFLYPFGLLPAQGPSPWDDDLLPNLTLLVVVGLLASYLISECVRAVRETRGLQDTLGKIAGAVVLTDGQGRVTFLNRAARTLTGCPDAEGVRAPLETIFRAVDEVSGRPVAVAGLLHGSEPAPALLRARDGTKRPIEYWAERCTNAAGRPAGILLGFRDISARRQQEQAWRERGDQFYALATFTPTGMLLLDRAGRCTFSNAAWQASAGCTAEESLGDGWTRFIPQEAQPMAAEWSAAARAAEPYTAEFRLRDAQGQVRWVRLRADAVRTDNGQWLGYRCTLEDVTSRKQLEGQLAEHQHTVDSLRHTQQEYVSQAEGRLAALDQVRRRLEQQLAEQQQAAEEQGRTQTRNEADWKRAEEKLRGENADLVRANQQSQEQLAERRRLEERLRREIAALTEANEQSQEQLTERRRLEEEQRETLAQREADWQQTEERLRQEIAELDRANQQAKKQQAKALQREQDLRQQHQELLAERQRHEEQLRRQQDFLGHALGHAEAGLIAWGADGALQLLNATARSFLGLPEDLPPAEQWDQYFQASYPEGSADPGRPTPFVQALHGQPCPRIEVVVAPKAGGTRTLLARGVRLRDGASGSLGYLLTLQDVTEHRRATDELRDLQAAECQRSRDARERWQHERAVREQALQQAQGTRAELERREEALQSQVRALQEAVRRLETGMERWTDGLRPLAARLREAALVVLAELRDVGPLREPAEVLEQQVQRLWMTLDGLWVVNRLARGHVPFHREPVNLGAVVQRSVQAYSPLLRARGHHLILTLPLQPEWFSADPERLEQVLVHLLDHAANDQEPGGDVRLTVQRAHGEMVLRVENDGSGGDTAEASGGTILGLRDDGGEALDIGLTLVRGLVELHGGTVRQVRAEPGPGGEWLVRLPGWATEQQLPALLALPRPKPTELGAACTPSDGDAEVLEVAG